MILDPARAEVVDLSWELKMRDVCAIADIMSVCGKHTQLKMQCASLRTCRLWSRQPSLKLAMSSEVVCAHCTWWNVMQCRTFSYRSVRRSQYVLAIFCVHQAPICDWQFEKNVDE